MSGAEVIALLGAAVLHVVGALLVAVIEHRPLRETVARPTSVFVSLSVLACASLGLPGVALAAVMAFGIWLAPPTPSSPVRRGLLPVGAIAGVVMLARPWVPLYWDEFVWLAKARLTSIAFDEVTRAALDPQAGVIPAGYVPLWPSSVGWLSLGQDSLSAYVVASSLLLLACLVAAIDAWWASLSAARWWVLVPACAAPLALVHVRAAYIDLPIGLLAAALLGRLLDGRAGLESIAMAVLLAGFKDEGVTLLVSVSVVAAILGSTKARSLGPLVAGVATLVVWRWQVGRSGVEVFDHALHVPAFDWLPSLGRLLAFHLFDLSSWGLTWPLALATLTVRGDRTAQALKWALAANLAFLCAAVLMGPERVRVFAENGSLLNRLLLQSWPIAALLLIAHFGPAQGSAVAPLKGRPVTDTST
jgi:hypothetical protein